MEILSGKVKGCIISIDSAVKRGSKGVSMKIYFPAPRDGKEVRHYKLLKQGLGNHPKTDLVDSPEKGDYIFLHRSCVKEPDDIDVYSNYAKKIIMLDHSDGLRLSKINYFSMPMLAQFTSKANMRVKDGINPIRFYYPILMKMVNLTHIF